MGWQGQESVSPPTNLSAEISVERQRPSSPPIRQMMIGAACSQGSVYDPEHSRDESHYPAGMRSVAAIVALVVCAAAARAAEGDAGARLYAERCSGCHGDDGKGDGPAAAALVPKPRNFREPVFWQDRTANDLKAIVRKGKVGTMMPPFAGVLSEDEIDAVVRHLGRFDPAHPTAP